MQIQNVEALKSWLTARLEPICDADPAALAKYVVALVKKDKAPEELKHVCKDQLEVFLSNETNKFVELLFESLESQSYLPPSIVEPTKTPEKIRKPSISDDLNTSKSLVDSAVPDDDERDFRRTRKNTDSSTSSGSKETAQTIGDKNRKRRAEDEGGRLDQAKLAKDEHGGSVLKKPDSDDTDVRRNGGSQAIPTSQASRESSSRERRYPSRRDFGSRSDDDDRFRRSGGPSWSYRGRGSDRGRDDRPGRMREHRDRDRHYEGNQRFGHRERGGKKRCRDYEEKGFCIMGELCPYDHGNDPVVIQDMPMQGMIPGFPPAPPFIPGGPPPLGGLPVPPPLLPPVPPVQGPPNQPPPPGTIPKVSEATDSPKGQKGDSSKTGSSAPESSPGPVLPVSGIQQPMVRPPPPIVMPIDRPPFIPMHGPRPPFPPPESIDSYNPEQPQFERLPVWMRIGTPGPPGIPAVPYNPELGMRSRELVTVPPNHSQLTVQVTTDKPSGESNRVVIGPETVNQEADNNQTNNTKAKPGWKRFNDTIELKKIPREFNNISKLNEHFQKFGNIVNIQVNAFGDSEAALIKFSNPSEAKAAYSCPDAVLGNRFIRVFWHQPDRENQTSSNKGNVQATKETKIPAKPTMFQSGKTTFIRQAKPATTAVPTTTTTVETATVASTIATSTTVTSTTPESKEDKAATATSTVTTTTSSTTASVLRTTPVTMATVPPSKHQQRQDIMKKKLEIQKQKQELLDKQIQQQKLLISKLEKKNLTATEKEAIMKTLKSLTKNIEGIKKEIELAAMTAKSKQSPSQARELAKKAILDQELDLITHQHSGEDTTELKKKVEELKQEAKSLGLFDTPGKGRGSSPIRGRGTSYPRGRGHRGRGRGHAAHNTRVWTKESAALDMNSKQICVANVKPTEKEDIIEHFMEFGNVDRAEYEEEKKNLTLTFRTRKEAEIAFKAKKLKDRVLELYWKKLPVPTPVATTSSTTPTTPIPVPRSRSSTLSSSKLDEELTLDLEGELEKHDLEHDEDDEALLLGDDLDEEEEDEEDRSWRR